MKFSSYSSSSSSTPYIDVGLRNSNNAAAGCVSRFLRSFLCGNLSNRSSNLIKEGDEDDSANFQKVEERIKPSPGIVARLMGLESMPELGSIPSVRNPESIGRSRSANSINNWLEFDPTQRLHRRVRTSLSFRETPTFLREENQDFILLCFGSDGGERPLVPGPKEPNSDMGLGELKENRREGSKRKAKEKRRESRTEFKKVHARDGRPSRRKIAPEMTMIEGRLSRRDCNLVEAVDKIIPGKREICSKPCSELQTENSYRHANRKEIARVMKLTREQKGGSAEKTAESSCSSENSSPVSVLDSPFDANQGFLNDSKNSTISDDVRMNSRRKLSLFAANFDRLSSHVTQVSISNDRGLKTKNNADGEKRKKRSNSLYCSDVWREICMMAGGDMKQPNWISVSSSEMEDVEEIGVEFEKQMFDFLLDETVEEIALLLRKADLSSSNADIL